MLRHIVVGCDGTDRGRDAIALGATLASATGARLTLLSVFAPALFPVSGHSDRRTLRRQAEAGLRRDRDLLAPSADIETVVDVSVPRALRHYAERWHAGLVVIGSDRGTAAGHAAISRRARQLLHDAPFALALAARGLHARPQRLRSIGLGFDGGPEAEAALGAAVQLARASEATLGVRRVVEDQAPALSSHQWIAITDWSHIWEQERKAALAEAAIAVPELGVRTDVSATVGDPGYQLRTLSEDVDLMVIGSRRWGPAARLVTGGVGETLLADASSSILIVPRGAAVSPLPTPARTAVKTSI